MAPASLGAASAIKGYPAVLAERAISPLGDLHYKLTVTDDNIELEPLLSIF